MGASASVHRPAVGFLFVGGRHQMLHMAPVAAELQRDGEVDVTAFVRDATDEAALRDMFGRFQAEIAIEALPLPFWTWPLALGGSSPKVPRLIAARQRLARLDVLVAAERSSTLLKRLPGAKPYLVHIPHGAGDRARGFEARLRLFDHVIVAGPKDRDRMIGAGLVKPGNCSVSGYIKLAAIETLAATPARLFANDRPVVLYNPHFAKELSSWDRFGADLIAAFRANVDFNLVVAPHVRLAERLSAGERARIEKLAIEDRILIDFGSSRSSDMSYTRGADIYVGDVSSQVYEFVSTLRPCVFLNAGAAAWQDDPNHAFWHFGEVVTRARRLYPAILEARARHPVYAPRQAEAVRAALGPMDPSPIVTAARILTGLAKRRMALR